LKLLSLLDAMIIQLIRMIMNFVNFEQVIRFWYKPDM